MPWELTGNAGTDPANDFLGSTDNQPLAIRTYNRERLRIMPDGRLLTNSALVFVDSNGIPYPDNWIGPSDVGGPTPKLRIQGFTVGGVNRLQLYADDLEIQGNAGIHVWGTALFTGGGQRPGLLSNGGIWQGVDRNVPYPAVPVGGNLSGAESAPGELVVGGVRTSIRGFDGDPDNGLPLGSTTGPPAQAGLRRGDHWIRTNGNENERWMAFSRERVGPYYPYNYYLSRTMKAAVGWIAPKYSGSSDARLKTNVRQVEGALDKLERIRGTAFEWAETAPDALGGHPGQTGIGVVAQEVEEVFPEVVSTYDVASAEPDQDDTAQEDREEYKAVDYAGLTSVLIEAVKELKAQNEALRSRIEALERTQQ